MAANFAELVSQDEKVKVELFAEGFNALNKLAAEKGFKEEARKAFAGVMVKVAEAHGFKADKAKELSEDELKAVAGGGSLCIPFVGGIDQFCIDGVIGVNI